ncbi:MAG: PDZ domain-containing protein [Candidatus Omnitrophica bacterium]|nr:PDZ domain-containing protein [Candidatus Omnitrophota bacterium]
MFAGSRPSLFRGVVVADSLIGVRVVSVQESSQAYQADLRPDDIIVQVRDQEVRSIDEFATLSNTLKGRAVSVPLLVFRNGAPLELTIHLYSYPILREWRVEFVPEHDIRFADPRVGLDYWARLGRGFESAGKREEALQAYLNGLHNAPQDVHTALKATELWSAVSQQQLADGRLAEGIAGLRHALTMMQYLFDYPLTGEQLRSIRAQLRETLHALRKASASPPLHTARNYPVGAAKSRCAILLEQASS